MLLGLEALVDDQLREEAAALVRVARVRVAAKEEPAHPIARGVGSQRGTRGGMSGLVTLRLRPRQGGVAIRFCNAWGGVGGKGLTG